MALSKRTYVGGTTKITAKNLNDIQDAIIALEGAAGDDGIQLLVPVLVLSKRLNFVIPEHEIYGQ